MPVHKSVLAASSSFFRAMFADKKNENPYASVTIQVLFYFFFPPQLYKYILVVSSLIHFFNNQYEDGSAIRYVRKDDIQTILVIVVFVLKSLFLRE